MSTSPMFDQSHEEYQVQAGDSLKTIAQKFYQNEDFWEKIYEANKDRIELEKLDSKLLQTGIVLYIPRHSLVAIAPVGTGAFSHEALVQEMEAFLKRFTADASVPSSDYKQAGYKQTDHKPNETSQQFGQTKKWRWTTWENTWENALKFLTGGFVFSVIGLVFTYYSWKQEQPELSLGTCGGIKSQAL